MKNYLLYCAATIALMWGGATYTAERVFAETDVVEFTSAAYTYTPSPFKLRQAKKQGIPVEVKTEPSVTLNGYLAKPEGDDPRPAIVLLHSCAGVTKHVEMWSHRLVSWGYVVLSVDSFTPRGYDYSCDGRTGSSATPWRRALDAYGAREFLASQAFVDATRIGVMGMSHGGTSALETIKQSISKGLSVEPFQVAIAFYPLCSEPEAIDTQTLILAGSEDNWTPAKLCADYLEKLGPRDDIRMRVFDGAHHLFDHPGIDTVDAGYVIRSDPAAAAEASAMVRDFLQQQLQ